MSCRVIRGWEGIGGEKIILEELKKTLQGVASPQGLTVDDLNIVVEQIATLYND